MKKVNLKKSVATLATTIMFQVICAHAALAGSSQGFAWESALQKIMKSISGPVVQYCAVIAVAVTGVKLLFGGGDDAKQQLIKIAFGVSLALGAASFISNGLGLSAGLKF